MTHKLKLSIYSGKIGLINSVGEVLTLTVTCKVTFLKIYICLEDSCWSSEIILMVVAFD